VEVPRHAPKRRNLQAARPVPPPSVRIFERNIASTLTLIPSSSHNNNLYASRKVSTHPPLLLASRARASLHTTRMTFYSLPVLPTMSNEIGLPFAGESGPPLHAGSRRLPVPLSDPSSPLPFSGHELTLGLSQKDLARAQLEE
jgi:hypothetical protein